MVLHLIKTKCLRVLLYGLEICSLTKTDQRLLDFAVIRFLRATAATAVARFSHRNCVCQSVRLFVTRMDQSKTLQARITKSSALAARKTLVSGTVKLFHKLEGGHPDRWR